MSRFKKVLNLIYEQENLFQFNLQKDNIFIINFNELNNIVMSYYQQYYQKYPQNNKSFGKIRLGETINGDTIYGYPESPHEILMADLKYLIYVRDQFRYYYNTPKKPIEFILILGEGHLKGILKYWHESSEKYPCLGFISINQLFKNKGYSNILLRKLFQHHKELFPEQPLLFTQFSEEGSKYIKNKVLQLSKEYNVDIFVSDDVRRYFEDIIFGKNKFYNNQKQLNKQYTFPIPEKIKNDMLERAKKYD